MSRTESLAYALTLLSSCAIFFRILFVGARLPRERWWIGERWLCDVWMPILLIGFSFSIDFAVTAAVGKGALFTRGLPLVCSGVAMAIAVVAWVLLGRLLTRGTLGDEIDQGPPTLGRPRSASANRMRMRPTHRRAA